MVRRITTRLSNGKRGKNGKTTISFKCSRRFAALVDKAAEDGGVNRSQLIRMCVGAFMKSQKTRIEA